VADTAVGKASNRRQTCQTEDLKAMIVPTLVLQGDDDQVVPLATSKAISPA
jgi:hypothetical protein